jgi:hypothetical protein
MKPTTLSLVKAVPWALRRHKMITVLGLAAIVASTQLEAAPFQAEIDLADLLPANGGDGTTGFVLNGIDLADRSGTAVDGVGDVNGDGIGDFIVSAEFGDGFDPNS